MDRSDFGIICVGEAHGECIMSHRHEFDHANEGELVGSRGTAAASARAVLSQEALDLARDGQQNSPRQLEAPQKLIGATPGCLFADSGLSADKAAARNDVIRTYRYKDGTTITDHANGDSIKTGPEGSKVTTRKDGTMIFQDRDGKVNMVVAKDGTTTQIDHKKGTMTTEYPNGTVIIEEKNGTKTRLNRGFLRQGSAR
jgi:hypothetical protein